MPDPGDGTDPPTGDASETRTDAVRDIVLGRDGRPHGREDSKGVYLVDEATLDDMRVRLVQSLGEPSRVMQTGKGTVETWMMGEGSRANVTYRTYSTSGGATIDVNRLDGLDVARYHIDGGS